VSDDHLGDWGLFTLDGDDMAWANLRVLRFADGPERPGLDAWATGGALWWRAPTGGPAPLLAEAELPACVGGAVRTMVENALCAALLARALGLTDAAVRGASSRPTGSTPR
jgi:hypothetical protein